MSASTPGCAPSRGASPGLARVLASCIYDALLTLAILFVAAAAAVGANAGHAIEPGSAGFRIYLLAAAFPYFGYCWTRGGQTIGMRAWGLRVAGAAAGGGISLAQALARFLAAALSAAALGLGFVWIALDRNRRSWHDMLSGTRLEVVAGAARR